MQSDPQLLIQSLIRAELLQEQRDNAADDRPPCTVTVSRQSGALGKEFVKTLAQRLNLPCYDKALVEAMARTAGVDLKIFSELDESVKALRSNWLELLFTDRPLHQQKYLQTLIDVVIGIYRNGGVILGRGANFILDEMPAFRLRIVGSLSLRARRYAAENNIDEQTAREKVRALDSDREAFVQQWFGRDPAEPVAYDLVMNSDHLDVETMVAMTVEGLRVGRPCRDR